MTLRTASLGSAFFALLLYIVTLAPTFGWGDNADLAMRMVYHGDHTFVGSSRDYILFRSIGALFQLLPFGDAGYRANMMTACFGAVAVGLTAFISGYVSRNVFAAWAAGLALAVSHTFWLMSVIAEVYTFNTTLVLGCYAFLIYWWRTGNVYALAAAAICNGLALFHHSTGLVLAATVAPLVLMRIRQIPFSRIVPIILLFIAVSFPYWQRTILRLMADQALMQAIGLQTPGNGFFDVSPLRELAKFLAYAFYNFLGIGFVFAVVGLFIAWRKKYIEMLPLILWMLLFIFAGVTSSIPDKFNIYVLVYPVLAICLGFGASAVTQKRWRAWILIMLVLVPPVGYFAAVPAARMLRIDLVGARTLPYRENDRYFMWPSKFGDNGPRRYAQEALRAIDKNGVLIADYTLWRPLYFMQAVEGLRPDVTVLWEEHLLWTGSVLHHIDAFPCTRSVYLATNTPAEYYQLPDILKKYSLQQQSVIFKVVRPCAQ